MPNLLLMTTDNKYLDSSAGVSARPASDDTSFIASSSVGGIFISDRYTAIYGNVRIATSRTI